MSTARKIAPEQHFPVDETSILSPAWDILFAGGISAIIYVCTMAAFQKVPPDAASALFIYNLSFLINFPHFLVSYQLLYGDFRKKIFSDVRFFWAAVLAPVLLGGFIASGFVLQKPEILGISWNLMYFFVGWHYIKQTFGAIMVGNALKKTFYDNWERRLIKINLYALWAVSFLAMNVRTVSYQQLGITYTTLSLPEWTLTAANWICYFSALSVVVTQARKYVVQGITPSGIAVFSFGTIYLWMLPVLAHPRYTYVIPALHSLQYLLFVYAFRKNKVDAHVGPRTTPQKRMKWLEQMWGYMIGSAILGAISFHFLPNFLDTLHWADAVKFGTSPAVMVATVFINIHHYFIDNVIWRGTNPEIRTYLFRATKQKNPAESVKIPA